MAAAVKLVDGVNNFVPNRFPARHKLKTYPVPKGPGARRTSSNVEPQKSLVVVSRPKQFPVNDIKNQTNQIEKDNMVAFTNPVSGDEKVLNQSFLLKHCCVQEPEDVCTANVTGQNLTDAVTEDLERFRNVAIIIASDNLLTLEPLSSFPALQELQLAVNGIRGIKLDYGMFTHLQKLDISFNNLSSNDVGQLGNLPQLTELDISCNNLFRLPVNMASPLPTLGSPDGTSCKLQPLMRFAKLQKLVVDDNKLHSDDTFAALAGLPSLLHLSVQKNDIQRIPRLVSVNNQYFVYDKAAVDQRQSAAAKRSVRPSSRRSPRKPQRNARPHTVDDAERNEAGISKLGVFGSHIITTPPSVSVAESTSSPLKQSSAAADDVVEMTSRPGVTSSATNGDSGEERILNGEQMVRDLRRPPFANLKHLNLTTNKISKEEAVLAVTAWPNLDELILCDNPLTVANRTSNLLIVNKFLREKLDIQVQCQKSVSPGRPRIDMTLKSERQINSKVPAIPRCNVHQMSIEAAAGKPSGRSQSACELSTTSAKHPLPPIISACNWSVDVNDNTDVKETTSDVDSTRSSELGSKGTKDEEHLKAKDAAPIFMTEAGDAVADEEEVDESDLDVLDDDDVAYENDISGEISSHVAKKPAPMKSVPGYEGYELLFDGCDSLLDDSLPQPGDIVGNVRTLQYALSHPLVFGDSKVQLDQKHSAYRPPAQKHAPGKPSRRTKADKVDAILNNMRTLETYVEEPLVEAMANGKKQKDSASANELLAEVQRRFDAVRGMANDRTDPNIGHRVHNHARRSSLQNLHET